MWWFGVWILLQMGIMMNEYLQRCNYITMGKGIYVRVILSAVLALMCFFYPRCDVPPPICLTCHSRTPRWCRCCPLAKPLLLFGSHGACSIRTRPSGRGRLQWYTTLQWKRPPFDRSPVALSSPSSMPRNLSFRLVRYSYGGAYASSVVFLQ